MKGKYELGLIIMTEFPSSSLRSRFLKSNNPELAQVLSKPNNKALTV